MHFSSEPPPNISRDRLSDERVEEKSHPSQWPRTHWLFLPENRSAVENPRAIVGLTKYLLCPLSIKRRACSLRSELRSRAEKIWEMQRAISESWRRVPSCRSIVSKILSSSWHPLGKIAKHVRPRHPSHVFSHHSKTLRAQDSLSAIKGLMSTPNMGKVKLWIWLEQPGCRPTKWSKLPKNPE